MIAAMLKIQSTYDQSCPVTKTILENIQILKLQCARKSFFIKKDIIASNCNKHKKVIQQSWKCWNIILHMTNCTLSLKTVGTNSKFEAAMYSQGCLQQKLKFAASDYDNQKKTFINCKADKLFHTWLIMICNSKTIWGNSKWEVRTHSQGWFWFKKKWTLQLLIMMSTKQDIQWLCWVMIWNN